MKELRAWREGIRAGAVVVATNGCFDVLHAGHVQYLQAAKELGDYLVVGLNSDASVRALKGPARPVNTAADRMRVLLALACVDAVAVFEGTTAVEFLEAVRPTIWVKGGDYVLGEEARAAEHHRPTVVGVKELDREERRVVECGGGRIVLLPLLVGRSTTGTLEKLMVGGG
jgi:D-beta-D-heptose 7-phosphate kinase / D-beta-D-heptose 1-phosphate adenosyltransferase